MGFFFFFLIQDKLWLYNRHLFIKKKKKRKEKKRGVFGIGQNLAIKLVVTLGLLNIFLFEVNFDKSIIRLYLLLIFSILAKF